MKQYQAFILQLILLLVGFISNPSFANQEIYQAEGLQYTLVKTIYLTSLDLQSNYTSVFFHDYEPKRGTLIVTLEPFYDAKKITAPVKHLSLSPSIQCLTETCDDSAVFNSKNNTHLNKPIITSVFEDDNLSFVKLFNKNAVADKTANQFTYKSMREPKKIAINIKGNLNNDAKDAYAVLVTAFYVTETPSVIYQFLDSNKGIILIKFLLLFIILSYFGWLVYLENKFASRPVLGMGIFVLLWGIINLLLWQANYMVIGTSFIALSGVYILFSKLAAKYIFGFATLFLTVFIGLKFEFASKDFFMKLAFLYIMALMIYFLNLSSEE